MMHAFEHAARLRAPNAIHPYTWRADYIGGGRLLQYDVDGKHFSPEIDRFRCSKVVILGHRHGALEVLRPHDEPPDEVIVRARTLMVDSDAIGESGEPIRIMRRSVVVQAGFRYGTTEHLVSIDEAGRVQRTTTRGGS